MREELIAAIVITIIVCATYLTAMEHMSIEQLLYLIMAILAGIGFGTGAYYRAKLKAAEK